MNNSILVIDDELSIQKLLEITLISSGYKVDLESNGGGGLVAAARKSPDLIILDLSLPDENGHIILKKLRQWYSSPIIILSVHSSEEDIIMALDNGANDYLVKPFRTGELLARIRSVLRDNQNEENNPIIFNKEFEFDLFNRTIRVDNEVLKLTATQYDLLVLFGKNEGKVLTHQYILKEIWGPDHIDQLQYLRVFITQLRKKIEKDPNRPKYIRTEAGVGYRFVVEA